MTRVDREMEVEMEDKDTMTLFKDWIGLGANSVKILHALPLG